jgi:tetratricopeptide (TPR) repeat protein
MNLAAHQVKVRLARHYLDKLRTASMAIRRGQASAEYGMGLFEREKEQIEHWQTQAADLSEEDSDWTQLCQEYSLASLGMLSNRRNLADQASWLEAGLAAAIKMGNERAELAILDELSQVYGLLGAVDKSAHFAERLLKRGREAEDRLSIGRAYYAIGSIAEDRGQYTDSLEYTQRALDVFSEVGVRTDQARALHHLGAVALYLGDSEKAYHYFSRHLDLVEAISDMSEVCRGLLSVGQALINLEEFAKAEPLIRRAIRISRRLGFHRLLGAGSILLAQWFGEQGQIDLELKYYGEGISAARKVGSRRDVIHGLSNSGLARMIKGDFDGALSDLKEGLELARQAGLPRFICNIQRNIADTHLARGEVEAARPAFLEALSLAHEMGSSYQMVKAVTSAIGYWQLVGHEKQAATWAGSIMNRAEVDQNLFQPICKRLEAALGRETYYQALDAGQKLDLNEVVIEILSQDSELRE